MRLVLIGTGLSVLGLALSSVALCLILSDPCIRERALEDPPIVAPAPRPAYSSSYTSHEHELERGYDIEREAVESAPLRVEGAVSSDVPADSAVTLLLSERQDDQAVYVYTALPLPLRQSVDTLLRGERLDRFILGAHPLCQAYKNEVKDFWCRHRESSGEEFLADVSLGQARLDYVDALKALLKECEN